MARNRIFKFLRGFVSAKPILNDGEPYFATDTGNVYIGNSGTDVVLATTTNVQTVQSSLDVTNGNVETLTNNVASINQELDSKLTTPTGSQGQFLGFTADNVVGAVDAPQSGSSPFNSTYKGTLPTSGWVSDSGHYYYQVTISDITAESLPLVFPQWTSNKTNEQASWNTLESNVESFNGYVRFYASAPITTAVPYTLLYTNYDSSVITLINNIEGTSKTGTFIPA